MLSIYFSLIIDKAMTFLDILKKISWYIVIIILQIINQYFITVM